jgi:hypothetical protein
MIIVSYLVKHHVHTLSPEPPTPQDIRSVLTTNSDRQDQRTSRSLDEVVLPMRSQSEEGKEGDGGGDHGDEDG